MLSSSANHRYDRSASFSLFSFSRAICLPLPAIGCFSYMVSNQALHEIVLFPSPEAFEETRLNPFPEDRLPYQLQSPQTTDPLPHPAEIQEDVRSLEISGISSKGSAKLH